MSDSLKLLVLLLALIGATGAALYFVAPIDEEEFNQQQYCEMVALHRTDLSIGWPDFHHNFNKVCKGNKHAR